MTVLILYCHSSMANIYRTIRSQQLMVRSVSFSVVLLILLLLLVPPVLAVDGRVVVVVVVVDNKMSFSWVTWTDAGRGVPNIIVNGEEVMDVSSERNNKISFSVNNVGDTTTSVFEWL